MLIQLCNDVRKPFVDCELVDILRAISQFDSSFVISHVWMVSELDLHTYGSGGFGDIAIQIMFPEVSQEIRKSNQITVPGERLLERSALIHQLESGLFQRVVNIAEEVIIDTQIHLWNGPDRFQGTNIDFEIRRDEVGPYEIVTHNIELAERLKLRFG